MDWYPFYFTLYEQDTMHLNPYQDGCYRRLIDHYMKTRAPLPDNDAALARIVGDSEANWVAMASPLVRPFFRAQNGRLFHAKCNEVLDDQDNRTNKLSVSGKKGAEKRWNKIKYIDSPPNGHPIATPLGSAIAQYNTSTVKEKEITKVISKKKNAVTLEQLSINHVDDWLAEKRLNGKYLDIDEQELLEMFKDYCRSKNPKYSDYVAAFRNSFKWANAPRKRAKANGKQDYSDMLLDVYEKVSKDFDERDRYAKN